MGREGVSVSSWKLSGIFGGIKRATSD